MPDWGNGKKKTAFLMLRALQCCSVAGCLEEPEFAHKPDSENGSGLNGRGRGRNKRYFDIINHPECYLPLCQPHHKAYDRGELQVSGAVMFGWLVPVVNCDQSLQVMQTSRLQVISVD